MLFHVLYWQVNELDAYRHGGSFDTAERASACADVISRTSQPPVRMVLVTVPQVPSGQPVQDALPPRTFHF